jgi:hypothetical protein
MLRSMAGRIGSDRPPRMNGKALPGVFVSKVRIRKNGK